MGVGVVGFGDPAVLTDDSAKWSAGPTNMDRKTFN